MEIPYTRLIGSEIWNSAKSQYDRNGHAYHGFYHVATLYAHAQRLHLDYCEELDLAVLAHDVILDGGADPEIRSSEWLAAHADDEHPQAHELILTTIDHRPASKDNRLALLDLADFMSPDARRHNTRLLRDEAAAQKGSDFDQKNWVKGTLMYLKGLHERIHEDLESGQDIMFRNEWQRIRHGIRCTIATMPLNYAPHPAQGIQRYTRGQEAVLHLLDQGGCSPQMLIDLADGEAIDRDAMVGIVRRLKDECLASTSNRMDLLTLTEAGQEWCNRMNAPEENWPEPEF